MSGFGSFLKRNRMLLIVPTFLAGQFYIWWKIQQDERLVPQHQQKELFVKPLEYAKTLYGRSESKGHREEERRV